MKNIKELIGIKPYEVRRNVFSPSKVALRMSVSKTSNFRPTEFSFRNTNPNNKILVIGTEDDLLRMENGKEFLTGNHPIETFVPLLHLENAGFTFEFASPTGKPIKLEEWALPKEDERVMKMYQKYKTQMESPKKLGDVVLELESKPSYLAIFIPGGHGAILDLPYNLDLKEILDWALTNNKYIISLCHGPAALLAASVGLFDYQFPLRGYSIAAFPDALDRILTPTGYLPGKMPWYFGEKLKELGMHIVNNGTNGTVHRDRNLITGDSPNAANKLGIIAASILLEEVAKNN